MQSKAVQIESKATQREGQVKSRKLLLAFSIVKQIFFGFLSCQRMSSLKSQSPKVQKSQSKSVPKSKSPKGKTSKSQKVKSATKNDNDIKT